MPPFPPMEFTDLIVFAAGVMSGFFIGMIARKSNAA